MKNAKDEQNQKIEIEYEVLIKSKTEEWGTAYCVSLSGTPNIPGGHYQRFMVELEASDRFPGIMTPYREYTDEFEARDYAVALSRQYNAKIVVENKASKQRENEEGR